MSSFVQCPQCQRHHEVTLALQGRKTKCPCGFVFRMPGDKSANDPVAYAEPVAAVSNRPFQPSPVNATVPAQCPSCFKSFQIKAEMSGKSIRCHCGNVFVVPQASEEQTLDELPIVAQPLAAPVIPSQVASNQVAGQFADPFAANQVDPFAPVAAPQANQYWNQPAPQIQYQKVRPVVTRTVQESDDYSSAVVRAIGGVALLGGLALAGLLIFMMNAKDWESPGGSSGRGLVKLFGLVILCCGSGGYWLITGSWGPASD